MERLILDTGVLMGIERRKVSLDQALADDDDPAIAAITAAELLQGVELADGVNRVARQSFVDTVLATIPVEEYTGGRGPRTPGCSRMFAEPVGLEVPTT
ncbi:hypothetical protein AB0D86_32055 [Streptomyces sp. NPDC048324]|uniref:hypothetical protein n=1 Tax=Streptomyces sp. NPDC048324 TaxID=3157205 RepID=UPI003446E27A